MLGTEREKRRRMLKRQAPRITTSSATFFQARNWSRNQFTFEKRRRLLGSYFSRLALFGLSALMGLAACTPKEIQDLVIPESEPVPVREMIPPTETQTSTPTESPTPTEAPKVDEHDLEPNFIQETSVEFMGVQINAQLITDKSLDPSITKVTVPDNVYAEFIARTIFKTWWKKGNEKHAGLATKDDFKAFMALWAKAQETNDPADWEKVQLNEIWANDLNDGNGYVQEPYTIWPMFDGEAPEGVRGIKNIAVALLKADEVRNITPGTGSYGGGYAANLEGLKFYVYNSPGDGLYSVNNITSVVSSINILMLRYNGGTGINFDKIPYDRQLFKLLSGKLLIN